MRPGRHEVSLARAAILPRARSVRILSGLAIGFALLLTGLGVGAVSPSGDHAIGAMSASPSAIPYLPADLLIAAQVSKISTAADGGADIVHAVSPHGSVLTGAGRGLTVSEDRGRTWHRVAPLPAIVQSVAYVGDQPVAASANRLYTLPPGHQQWGDVSPAGVSRTIAVAAAGSSGIWLAYATAGGSTRLALSTDLVVGRWIYRDSPCARRSGKEGLLGIASSPSALWALCRGAGRTVTMKATINQGRTWSSVITRGPHGEAPFDGITSVARFGWSTSGEGWLLAAGGQLWVAQSVSAPWVRMDAGGAAARSRVTDFTIAPSMFVAVANGSVFLSNRRGRWRQAFPEPSAAGDVGCQPRDIAARAFWQGYQGHYVGELRLRNSGKGRCVVWSWVRIRVATPDGAATVGQRKFGGEKRLEAVLDAGRVAAISVSFSISDCVNKVPAGARLEALVGRSGDFWVTAQSRRPPCGDLVFGAMQLLPE